MVLVPLGISAQNLELLYYLVRLQLHQLKKQNISNMDWSYKNKKFCAILLTNLLHPKFMGVAVEGQSGRIRLHDI
jgi:hypothetical protein